MCDQLTHADEATKGTTSLELTINSLFSLGFIC